MRRLLIVTLLMAATWTPAARSAVETGTIHGSVRLKSRVRGNAIPTAAYTPRAVERYQPPPTPEIKYVLVYLTGIAFHGALPAMNGAIVQEHEAFVPRVLAVTRGSSVSFPNSDPIFHNVFSLSGAGLFDLGRYPRGQSRSRVFQKAGLVKVYCHIHSQMSASIMIFDHPFFTAPRDDGTFEIADVPAGRYTIVGWHERVGERSRSIEVTAGEPTEIELSLPVDATP
jgi:plastocyanin